MAKSRWFVFTGRSSSGITSTLEALKTLGYQIFPEMARVIIDEGIALGLTAEKIRQDEAAFQREALRRKLELEHTLPRDEIILFDRGVPDSVPYGRVCGLNTQAILKMCEPRLYQMVFYMEPLEYKRDYARTETPETLKQLERELLEVYRDLSYEVIKIPPVKIIPRVKMILPYLRSDLPID